MKLESVLTPKTGTSSNGGNTDLVSGLIVNLVMSYNTVHNKGYHMYVMINVMYLRKYMLSLLVGRSTDYV